MIRKYTCLIATLHSGVRYIPPAEIELEEGDAHPLLLSGAITPVIGETASEEDVQALRMAVAGIAENVATALPEPSSVTPAPPVGDGAAIDKGAGDAPALDTLIEQAVRAFGPDDFTAGGEPRMSVLGDAVQKLAYPNGEETGVIVTSEDRDRVFKRMLTAEFKVPVADAVT